MLRFWGSFGFGVQGVSVFREDSGVGFRGRGD